MDSIFTSLTTLAGVALGAFLNDWLRRGQEQRKHAKDLAVQLAIEEYRRQGMAEASTGTVTPGDLKDKVIRWHQFIERLGKEEKNK